MYTLIILEKNVSFAGNKGNPETFLFFDFRLTNEGNAGEDVKQETIEKASSSDSVSNNACNINLA